MAMMPPSLALYLTNMQTEKVTIEFDDKTVRQFLIATVVWAIVAIGGLSFIVWAHHMYVSGMNPYFGFFFATTTLIIAVPTAIKVVVAKKKPKAGCMPLTYMWWAQTTKLRPPMATMAHTIMR